MTVFVRTLLSLLLAAFAALGPAAGHAAGTRYEKVAFDRAVVSGQPVVLHVSAPWCPTCKAQKPVVDALLKEPRMQAVRLFVADFDTEKALKKSLHVAQQSTFAKGL